MDNRFINLRWTLVVLIVVFFGLTGCEQKSMSDLTKYITEVKAKPKSAIEPLPEIKVVEPFLFSTTGQRDPFAPIVDNPKDVVTDSGTGTGIKPDPLHQKEELEQFPLDALKMMGTVTLKGELWALVTANGNSGDSKTALSTIYRVKPGNYMGMNFGKITRISTDKIELTEIVLDKPGSWREQEQTLPLVLAE